MLQTAKPSRMAMPTDQSDAAGWFDSKSISGNPPTSSSASSPMVVNAWHELAVRRDRAAIEMQDEAIPGRRASEAKPACRPARMMLPQTKRDRRCPERGHQAGAGEPEASAAPGPSNQDERRQAQHRVRRKPPCSRTRAESDWSMHYRHDLAPAYRQRASPDVQRAPSRNRMTRTVASRISRSSSRLRFFT